MMCWENRRDRRNETYEQYLDIFYSYKPSDDRPGYDRVVVEEPVSKSWYYYVQSGKHTEDLQTLESTRGPHGFNREDFEHLCNVWWKDEEVKYDGVG